MGGAAARRRGDVQAAAQSDLAALARPQAAGIAAGAGALRYRPWNIVARAGQPVALIDFEFAGRRTRYGSWLRPRG